MATHIHVDISVFFLITYLMLRKYLHCRFGKMTFKVGSVLMKPKWRKSGKTVSNVLRLFLRHLSWLLRLVFHSSAYWQKAWKWNIRTQNSSIVCTDWVNNKSFNSSPNCLKNFEIVYSFVPMLWQVICLCVRIKRPEITKHKANGNCQIYQDPRKYDKSDPGSWLLITF